MVFAACCTICKAVSPKDGNIVEKGDASPKRHSSKHEPWSGKGDHPSVNIGIGLGPTPPVPQSQTNGKKTSTAAAERQAPAAVKGVSNGTGAAHAAPASQPPAAALPIDPAETPFEDLWSMPFQRARRRRKDEPKGWALIREKKSTMVVLHKFLAAQQEASREENARAVSVSNAPTLNMVVVRGPGWRWGDDDGGAGNPGTITAISEETGTVSVFWHVTGLKKDHYQYEVRSDLCVAPEGLASPQTSLENPQTRKQHTPMRNLSKSKVGEKPAEAAGGAEDESKQAVSLPSQQNSKASVTSTENTSDTKGLKRHNSQAEFHTPQQTIIIFDWDDTLFPTTYVRDDLNLSCSRPVDKQRGLSLSQIKEINAHLERCEVQAEKLLRQAALLGKVVFVTLARSPWVSHCCANFYPKMGEAVKKLNIPIVYAQEGNQVDYDKQKMMSNDEIEQYWAGMKGKAISREITAFYSQYPGQTWKNIISIGDSDFERLGTFQASEQYLREKGLIGESARNFLVEARGHTEGMVDDSGHVYHVRTKSFKMIDQPTPEELHVELPMIRGWIPQLVYLDRGCDFDLDALDSHEHIKEIEDTLRGVKIPDNSAVAKQPSLHHLTKSVRKMSKDSDIQSKGSRSGSGGKSPKTGSSPRPASPRSTSPRYGSETSRASKR